MKIIDLAPEHEELFCNCLEDWSAEMKESGSHKKKWLENMRDSGFTAKLATDDEDNIGGMIQYLPIERSHVEGNDLYFIMCVWVHGYKEGRGNFQKKGMGKALLKAAEEDARQKGAKGIAAWGVSMPFWMKASWFKKQGYKTVDKDGMAVLLWKSFTDDAKPPKWVKQVKKPQTYPGKVTVMAFKNGWCPASNIVFERAKRAAAEFSDKVDFQEIDTFNMATFHEWGILDAVYIDGKVAQKGPPPSYEDIKKMIGKRVRKIK